MSSFINGIGMISPQKTAESGGFLEEIMEYTSEFLPCVEPNYKNYIEPIAARRMSRLIKMGITSAKICLKDAGCDMPDGIITGTGLGSVEDTEKILGNINMDSPLTNPTPFIQSTYNTISSQIAINLKCTNYNSTYVHRIFSFESGLTDALMQISDDPSHKLLVGGIDEMTGNHLSIIRRLGHWKMNPASNLRLLDYETPGAMAGQGAGYFLISGMKTGTTYCKLLDVATIYKPGYPDISERIHQFIRDNGLEVDDIDLVITGINGDRGNDELYYRLGQSLFDTIPLSCYKHLCGEYLTSSAFALWVAANILRRKIFPQQLLVKGTPPEKIRNILIYNHFRQTEHSLILVSGID